MGTNFYIRRKDPEIATVKDYHVQHIAKTSYGWLPLFEYSDGEYGIHSVEDIRRLMATGDYVIEDEYGEVYDFERFAALVLDWDDDATSHIGYAAVYEQCSAERYSVDGEGYEFYRGGFC